MLDPNLVHPRFDYRDFGDMFFDIKNDPLEVDNKINDKKYEDEITRLRSFYDEFVRTTPSTGKDMMIKQKQLSK